MSKFDYFKLSVSFYIMMSFSIEVEKLKQIGILVGVLFLFYLLASTGNALFNVEDVDNKGVIWPFCDFIYLRDNPFRDPSYYPNQTRNTIVFQGFFYGFDFSDLLINFIIGLFFLFEFNKYLNRKDYFLILFTFLVPLILSIIPDALNHREGFWPIPIFKDSFSIINILNGFSSTEFSVYAFVTVIIVYLIKKSSVYGK